MSSQEFCWADGEFIWVHGGLNGENWEIYIVLPLSSLYGSFDGWLFGLFALWGAMIIDRYWWGCRNVSTWGLWWVDALFFHRSLSLSVSMAICQEDCPHWDSHSLHGFQMMQKAWKTNVEEWDCGLGLLMDVDIDGCRWMLMDVGYR